MDRCQSAGTQVVSSDHCAPNIALEVGAANAYLELRGQNGSRQIGQSDMSEQRTRAAADFRKMMKLIVVLAGAMVGGGVAYASLFTELTVHLVVATILGVFLSVVLGSGLFALAFFSDKSGHDDDVTNATKNS